MLLFIGLKSKYCLSLSKLCGLLSYLLSENHQKSIKILNIITHKKKLRNEYNIEQFQFMFEIF